MIGIALLGIALALLCLQLVDLYMQLAEAKGEKARGESPKKRRDMVWYGLEATDLKRKPAKKKAAPTA